MAENYEGSDYGEFEYIESETESESYVLESDTLFKDIPLCKKGSITFVTIDDIKQIINKKCTEISEVLGVTEDEAIMLYSHFKWRKDLIEEQYFEDQENIRRKAGIDPASMIEEPKTQDFIKCSLCFEQKPRNEFEGLKCNHLVCKDCWRDYIEYNTKRPEHIFFWKCPFEGCSLIVPNSFNRKYLKDFQEPIYDKKFAIAYADTSKSMKWCPAPGCYYASEVETIAAKCVDCPCGWMYCFKCGLEDHRPCDCDRAKEQLESTTPKWILINTKNCPKCKSPIEKNQGCNHMRCRYPGCGQEFCWLCLTDWKTHNRDFRCNRYDNLAAEKNNLSTEEQKKANEKQKYLFYYQRFMDNSRAIDHVNNLMKKIKREEKDLSENLSLSLKQLEFLEQACQILRNSKRTLKWSYSYGFYLTNALQRNLYELIQKKLDMDCSNLHVLLELDYLEAKKNIGDFTKFKDKVMAASYKCKQSALTFLEKMEDFEGGILEEELRNRKIEKPNSLSKRKNFGRREDGIPDVYADDHTGKQAKMFEE